MELLTLVGLLEPVLSEDEDEVVAVGEEAVRLALVAPLLGEASDYVVDVGHAASHELVDGAREPRLRRVGQGDGVADPKVEAPAPGDRLRHGLGLDLQDADLDQVAEPDPGRPLKDRDLAFEGLRVEGGGEHLELERREAVGLHVGARAVDRALVRRPSRHLCGPGGAGPDEQHRREEGPSLHDRRLLCRGRRETELARRHHRYRGFGCQPRPARQSPRPCSTSDRPAVLC